MAIRGQRPKPVALKLISGAAAERIPDNPVVATGAMAKPGWLRGRAAKIWDEYEPILDEMGVTARADAHSFAAWCQLSALVEKGAHRMVTAQLAQWRALSNEFGLTPSARARLSMSPKSPASKADAWFHGEKAG